MIYWVEIDHMNRGSHGLGYPVLKQAKTEPVDEGIVGPMLPYNYGYFDTAKKAIAAFRKREREMADGQERQALASRKRANGVVRKWRPDK